MVSSHYSSESAFISLIIAECLKDSFSETDIEEISVSHSSPGSSKNEISAIVEVRTS